MFIYSLFIDLFIYLFIIIIYSFESFSYFH